MKFGIRYRAVYRYEQAVSLSPHVVRVFPRADQFLRVESDRMRCSGEADMQFRRDLFDNHVACLFFPRPVQELELTYEAVVRTPERNPFHFLLDSRALRIPPKYDDFEREMLGPYLRTEGRVALPEPLVADNARPTVETLVTINQWLHREIAYERREQGAPMAPEETLRRGSGSCRDMSVLLMEVLRRNGVAARLVSGFLYEGDVEEGERRAQGAMHLWVEAYLSGPGWIGLDPTNGVFCDHHAIPCAAGLVPEHVTPVSGCYYAQRAVASTLESGVIVERIEEGQG